MVPVCSDKGSVEKMTNDIRKAMRAKRTNDLGKKLSQEHDSNQDDEREVQAISEAKNNMARANCAVGGTLFTIKLKTRIEKFNSLLNVHNH